MGGGQTNANNNTTSSSSTSQQQNKNNAGANPKPSFLFELPPLKPDPTWLKTFAPTMFQILSEAKDKTTFERQVFILRKLQDGVTDEVIEQPDKFFTRHQNKKEEEARKAAADALKSKAEKKRDEYL